MKFYLSASISQKKELARYYKRIYKFLEGLGDEVYSGNLFKDSSYKEKIRDQEARERWYRESLRNIAKSDIIVVEISYPSTSNVGHELSLALEKGKPVVALYQEKKDPIFLRGIDDDKLIIASYNEDNLEEVLTDCLGDAKEQMDTRFTLLLPPKIVSFLNQVSKKKKIPKSVFIRKLIEEKMEEEK